MAKRDLGDVAVKALTRPGIGSALLAGLGVYLVLVLQRLLGTVADVVGSVPWNQDVGGYIARIIPNDLPATLGAPLPFALGVVFAFWQLAPVVPQLRMAHVVTRSILAALVGAAAALVIGGLVALIANYTAWDAYYQFGTGPSGFLRAAYDAAHVVVPATLRLLAVGLVVVPLAALLLWGWQQSHPPKTAPKGALDEV